MVRLLSSRGRRGGGRAGLGGGRGEREGGDPCRLGRLSECGEAEVVRHVIPVL